MKSICSGRQVSMLLSSATAAAAMAIFVLALPSVAFAQGGFPDGSVVKALVRTDGTSVSDDPHNAGSAMCGTLLVEKKGNTQRFVLRAKNIPLPAAGLGVFLANSPSATNGAVFVNVLSVGGTNSQWQLVLEGKDGPPPFLGVQDVNELAGLFVFVADETTNVYLRTMITPLVPKLSASSYRKRVKLTRPDPAPSAKATGVVRVKFDAKKGASRLEVRGRKLAAGNSYCVIYTPLAAPSDLSCDGGENLTQGKGFIRDDTGKGDDLPYGVDYGVTTVADLAGLNVYIFDSFGVVHLMGTIPGP
jgi:hypothetical protein